MFKNISDYYKENIDEQINQLLQLKLLLEEPNLNNLLKITQSKPTEKTNTKMLDLLHDRNKYLEMLSQLLNDYIKSIDKTLKAKRKDYHTIGFYVEESIGSLFFLGDYNINNNIYEHNENFFLEKEKISKKYKSLKKELLDLNTEKERLKEQSSDLNKIEIMMKKDQKIKGDLYELDKKINKLESELKNFSLQHENLYKLYENMSIYYRVIESLKELNIIVKESLFKEENHYQVFIYKEDKIERERRTSIAKVNTDLYHNLKESDIITNKVFISLENFIRALPEDINYTKTNNSIEIEDNFTIYTFHENGLITIDNIYGNIYDLFEIGIFDIIEKACNTITTNESYL